MPPRHVRPQDVVRLRQAIPILLLGAAAGCADVAPKQRVFLAASAKLPAGEWVEFAAPEPLRTTAYYHQVCFAPVAPFRLSDEPMGVVDQGGDPILIQAAASGNAGAIELPLMGYQDERVCFFVSDLDLDQEFDRVRLHASATLPVEQIEWQSTDK